MDKKVLMDFMAFTERMSLMNEPVYKVWAEFINPNRLSEPPAKVTISK